MLVNNIFFALWFLFPAAASNVAPIISAHIPFLKKYDAPIDGGRKFRGHALLGSHKTWRGIISGIIVSTIFLFVQQILVSHFQWAYDLTIPYVDYSTLPLFLLGPLFAIGALGGDALESFFKRQINIESGGSWLFFDQIDYVVGALLISLPFVILPAIEYVWLLLIWFGLHFIASYVGWLVGLKERPI